MSIIMFLFTSKKIPDVKSVQVFIRHLNTLKIRSKSVFYIIEYIHLRTKDISIEKKSI